MLVPLLLDDRVVLNRQRVPHNLVAALLQFDLVQKRHAREAGRKCHLVNGLNQLMTHTHTLSYSYRRITRAKLILGHASGK